MTDLNKDDKEKINKMNTTFLYLQGDKQVDYICEEADNNLEKYKDIEIPESMDKWFLEYNEKLNKEEERKRRRKKIQSISKRVAIIFLGIIVAGGAVTMSVDAFRIKFFNMVIQTSEEFSKITFNEKNNDVEKVDELRKDIGAHYYPEYIPKGYELKEIRGDEFKTFVFNNDEGGKILFSRYGIKGTTLIDTEDAEVSNVIINGNEAIVSIKDRVSIILWSEGESVFSIVCKLKKEELIKMAESVKLVDPE